MNNEVVLSDFSAHLVHDLIRCIYDASMVREALKTHSCDFLIIAHKYEIVSVLNEIATLVNARGYMNKTTVIEYLQTSHFHEIRTVKYSCLKYIRYNQMAFSLDAMQGDLGKNCTVS